MALTPAGRFLWTRPPRCFLAAPYRRHRGLCQLLARFVVAVGLLSLVWLFLASPEATAADGRRDDRGRETFDGGIKLEFANRDPELERKAELQASQKKCGGSVTCQSSHKSSGNDMQHGNMNISGLQPNRLQISRTSNEAGPIGKHSSKIDTHPPWCSGPTNSTVPRTARKLMTGKKYFLTAVLLVRIYAYDLAKLSTREMIQWMQYLSYAGVEHIYVYDAYLHRNESQRENLDCFIKNGYVTYVDWSHHARPKYTIAGTQVAAYQDCLDKYGQQFAWQAAIDIDEYPFCPGDRSQGFLGRIVWKIASVHGNNIGEISMQNYLYLGKALNDSRHPLLIDRLWRRTIQRANALVKPIYQPRAVHQANVHHNSLNAGYANYAPNYEVLRMGHYWGARLQEWGEDTPEILSMTMEDRGMETAVAAMQPCLTGCKLGCCR